MVRLFRFLRFLRSYVMRTYVLTTVFLLVKIKGGVLMPDGLFRCSCQVRLQFPLFLVDLTPLIADKLL